MACRRLEVKGDSKLVIDAVSDTFATPWRLIKIVKYIKTLVPNAVVILEHYSANGIT